MNMNNIWRGDVGAGLQQQTGRNCMGGGSELGETAAEEVAVRFSGINGEQRGWEINTRAMGKTVGHKLTEGDRQSAGRSISI